MNSSLSKPKSILASIGPVAIFFIAAVLVTQARGVPDNDYWGIISSIIRTESLFPSINELYISANEHTVAGAKIFYILNMYLTGGDNIGLSIITCIFSLAISVILSTSISSSFSSRTEALIAGILISLLVFTPFAAHNFFLGMSGVAWIGANLFTVLAAYTFWQSAERESKTGAALSLVLALLAAQFYSTGATALCVLGIQGFCSARTRRLGIIFFILGFAYLAATALSQQVPDYHGPRNFNISDIIWFSLTFIGGGISTSKDYAPAIGAAGLLAAFAAVIYSICNMSKDSLRISFWIGIISYAVMTSTIAAIGRSNLPGDPEAVILASRYATLPALFWIGLFGLVASHLKKIAVARYLWICTIAAVVAHVMMEGRERLSDALARAEGKDLATLALSLGIKDTRLIKSYVTSAPHGYYAIESHLKSRNHAPFNGRDFGCPNLGDSITAADQPPAIVGYLDETSAIQDPEWAFIRGWIGDRSTAAPPLLENDIISTYRCIAFLDAQGTVVGLGLGGVHRPDVAKALDRTRDDYGWSGYLNLQLVARQAAPANVYAAISTPSGWIKLQTPIKVGNPS